MRNQAWVRRNKLPRPRLQLRLVGAFACLCALALMTQAFVLATELSRLAGGLPSGGRALAEALPGVLARSLGISVLLLLPALVWIGIRVTFRIAGPMYRFERHLEAVARGAWPGPCRIREGDDLQEFCELLNAALESARAQGGQGSDGAQGAGDTEARGVRRAAGWEYGRR